VSETHIVHFRQPTQNSQRLEPSTCTEAETFALQVLDDSMEPEFREKCIIVVDPTGHAKEGSYVLAQLNGSEAVREGAESEELVENFLFRQLRKNSKGEWGLYPLNKNYALQATTQNLSDILGVIVQRAGTRRRYHKRYD